MQRRDFLRTFHSSPEQEPQADPTPLLSVSRFAMAGDFEISFDGSRYPQATAAALDALDQVQQLEKKLSVFIPESRMGYINKVAAYDPVPLDAELFQWISFCVDLHRETAGAFDITSTPLWKLWGFAQKKPHVPTESEIESALSKVGSQWIELNESDRTIRFAKPGIALNFGCIGKGIALDIASRILLDNGVDDFLFSGGLSSVFAQGSVRADLGKEEKPENAGWIIGIAHPMRPEKRLAELRLFNEAIGTSGSQKQFFRQRGRRYSHILDPRTGFPTENTLFVTVVGPTATIADALSTAFFVMEPTQVERYCQSHPDLAVLLVVATPHAPGYEILTFGFSDEKLRFFDK